MSRIKTEWVSEQRNPNEENLKERWQAEVRALEGSLAAKEEHLKRKQGSIRALLAGAGLDEQQIKRQTVEAKSRSREALAEAGREVAKPSFDIESWHKQDLELVQRNAERMQSPGNPHWQGYIWGASYAGRWWEYEGESEEVPSITYDTAANRFDPRTQAWGEGWFDGDYSRLHGYLAFTFNPPSWGHLQIYADPWFHGYYSLYSNDEWYNSEHARAELDSWVDIHQHFWRSRSYARRFTLAGDELHPTRYGRVDQKYTHSYFTDVGANDTVTIRVGARLYSYARAGGSHSILDFRGGSGNYIYVPYVYWYLYQ